MVANPNQNKEPNESKPKNRNKGKEIGRKALDSIKRALTHAVNAIKTIILDPMQGQSKALNELGESNAYSAGIVFIVLYLITALIGARKFLMPYQYFLFGNGGLGFGWYIKLLISGLVPVTGLFFSYLAIDKVLSKKNIGWMTYVFSAGVTVFPVSILFLTFWLPYPVYMAIGAFCLCITVLLVYSALSDVYNLSSQKAFWFAPILFLAVTLISKVFYTIIFY